MVTLLSVLALAACGGNSGGTDSSGGSNSATETEDISSMPVEVKNDAEAIKGGTLDVAVVMDTQFQVCSKLNFIKTIMILSSCNQVMKVYS